MSMSEGSQFDSENALMNDINMTPLIDVMLVLLIIFIITLPVINKAVKVNLPKGDAQAIATDEKSIDISITAEGGILWDKEPVDDVKLGQRIAVTSVQLDIPVLRVYADKEVRYERVAHLLSSAQKAGLSKIDFVTNATTTP